MVLNQFYLNKILVVYALHHTMMIVFPAILPTLIELIIPLLIKLVHAKKSIIMMVVT